MIALIDYGAGNIRSVENALRRLGASPVLTADPDLIRKADKVIFPGVGSAGPAMEELENLGLPDVLRGLTQPFLGICLGMQLMCAHSEEDDTAALGIFPECVLKFPPMDKVPHMGWNSCRSLKGPLFDLIEENTDFYFVHTYFAALGHDTIATCEYIFPFSAAMHRDNFFGVQFHPEKSGEKGRQLIDNFLKL